MVVNDWKEQMEIASQAGWSALQSGNWQDAAQAYDAAIKLARTGNDKIAEALFRSYRGEARQGQGRTVEARADIEHALALAQAQGCLQLVAHVHFLLSELDTETGDDSKAIDRLLSALDAGLQCKDVSTTEVAFGKLGSIYFELGWLEAACDCFRQAVEQGRTGPNEAVWLGNLGQTLAEMGQFEESIDLYHQALELARANNDLKAQAKCFASEGLSHFQQGRYQPAIACYREALNLSHAGNDLSSKSTWLGNLGNVFLKLGQADMASELAQEGLTLARTLQDKHAQAAHLDTLGDCYLQTGEVEKALSHFSDALTIGKAISDKLGERIYVANVARACKRLGKIEESLQHFRAAIQLFEEQRSRINSDTMKTSFAATGQNLYRDMIHTLLGAGHRVEALEYVGRAKSRAILDLLCNSPIDIAELEPSDNKSVDKLVARERDLSRQIARLERIYGHGKEDDSGHRGAAAVDAQDVPRLYSEWREVVDQLRSHHQNYATMVAVDSLRFPELKALWSNTHEQAVLPAQTAVVEFFLSDEFLFSAAVWSDCSQPEINILLDSNELAELLQDISDLLEMSSTESWEVPPSLCKRLYTRLFGSIINALPESIERLIIVPHGILHRLPFAALNDGQAYLVERYSLSYLPTLSLIPILTNETRAQEIAPLRYLVSAISDYSATRDDGIVFSSGLRSAAGLDDLSYTLEEGKTVYDLAALHVNDAKLLTNTEVKAGLLSMFGDYSVVHFAGHAVFNPQEPLASGLVLADGSILTAARILQDNALRTKCGKLLVLSACQTGVNVVTNGGEILGLARALMYAGMPNLILSLWEVADRSTSNLMQGFHNSWQAGKISISQALADSQREAISARQPIHAWAPFIHVGID